jgi:hypothetical protein
MDIAVVFLASSALILLAHLAPRLMRATSEHVLTPRQDRLLADRETWRDRLRMAETERLQRFALYELGWSGRRRYREPLCWEVEDAKRQWEERRANRRIIPVPWVRQ